MVIRKCLCLKNDVASTLNFDEHCAKSVVIHEILHDCCETFYKLCKHVKTLEAQLSPESAVEKNKRQKEPEGLSS
jgi:hypothetical protein